MLRKGRGFLLAAGILSIIIGFFGTIIMISSLINTIIVGSETIAAILLWHAGNTIFFVSIIILLLGILLVVKRNNKTWGIAFFYIGICLLIITIGMTAVLMLYGFLPAFFLLIIPTLIVIGGTKNRKE